jgi:hypothetical protein
MINGASLRGITIRASVRTAIPDSEVRWLTIAHNQTMRAQSMMMPGVLLTEPASKKGTTSAKTWRTEAFTFMFRGHKVSAAAQEKAFTATTHDIAVSKQAWYVLSLQEDGTSFTITKGADSTIGTDTLPTIPDNQVAIGWLKLTTGSGAIFDATTDDLAVTGTSSGIATLAFTDNAPIFLIGDESGVEITA